MRTSTQTLLMCVLRRDANVDLVRVQDVGLRTADDPTILAWAAANGRALLSHDEKTMRDYAYDRVRRGEPMPGVFIAQTSLPVADAINSILLLAGASREHDWEGQVRYLPL